MIADHLTRIQHLGIPTDKMHQTIEFYQKLGFELIYTESDQSGKLEVAFLKLNNLIIESYLVNFIANQIGPIDYFAVNVTQINSLFKKMKNENYEIIETTIQQRSFLGKKMAFFTVFGPNGEKIEFNQIR